MTVVSLKKAPLSDQHAHAHSLLSLCLAGRGIEYTCGVTPLSLGSHGKPSLPERPDVSFNLSHAEGITACIVTDSECGIDCERVRPFGRNVPRRAFSAAERALLEAAPPEERELLFFRIWTLKEAYVKMLGIGISYPLDSVSFGFSGDGILHGIEGCFFTQYIINGAAVVSVCCSRQAHHVHDTVTCLSAEEGSLLVIEND